jgi:hypothetical protein
VIQREKEPKNMKCVLKGHREWKENIKKWEKEILKR